MVKVANLSADLTANTTSFDQSLKRSSQQLTTTSRKMSQSAQSFNTSVSNSFRRAAQNVAVLQGPLGGVSGRLSAVATVATTAGLALGGIGLALSGVAFALQKAIRIGDSFEGSMNRINAIITATGGAAGLSAQEIRDFSQELARGTLASVSGVEAASAKLLTFRSIAGDTFKRTLTLAQDLAATGFGSLTSNVVQLGKVLEDPIRNLSQLARTGISFTKSQEAMIKALVEGGRAAEAQSIILGTIAKQVGGAGAAEGGGLAKRMDSLAQSIENFFVAINNSTAAGRFFIEVLKNIDLGFQNITKAIAGDDALTNIQRLQNETLKLVTLQKELAQIQALPTAGFAERDKKVEIAAQEKLIVNLARLSDADAKAAAARKKTAAAAKEQATADIAAGAATKTAETAAKAAATAEAARQKQIKSTIESLRVVVGGLELQNNALVQYKTTLAAASEQQEVYATQQKLGLDASALENDTLAELIAKRNELQAAIKTETTTRSRVTEIIEANKNETKKLNEELEEYLKLRNAGRLTEDEYQEAVTRTTEKINGLDEKQKALKETSKELQDAAKNSFKAFITGAQSAGEAVRNLGAKILDMIADRAISGLFDNILGPALDAGFGAAFGGFFADGGRPPVGQFSIVGERGPELFIPDTAGTIIPNDALQGSNDNGTTVYADMRGASVEAVMRLEAFMTEINGSIEPRSINAVVSEKQRNPALFGN